jgi:hypothetical protein
MTKANSLQPPSVATWLLERFSPVLNNAPLAGDLMEAFKQGRSSNWYWRQVFAAILIALPRLLWKQWGRFAYAIGFGAVISVGWFFISPNGGHDSALPQVFALYAKGYGFQWPWSFVYQIAFLTAFESVTVALALGAYLAFSRVLNRQNLFGALVAVVAVLAISNVVLPFLIAILSPMRVGLFGWVIVSAPLIIALIVGMWKARGGTSRPLSA